MPHDKDQAAAEMSGGVFNASKLVIIDDIACKTDHEKLTDTRRKDILRNDTRIRAGDNDRIRSLSVLRCPLSYLF